MGVLARIEVEEGGALLVHHLCRVEGTRADGRLDEDSYEDWNEGLELGFVARAIAFQGASLWCVYQMRYIVMGTRAMRAIFNRDILGGKKRSNKSVHHLFVKDSRHRHSAILLTGTHTMRSALTT